MVSQSESTCLSQQIFWLTNSTGSMAHMPSLNWSAMSGHMLFGHMLFTVFLIACRNSDSKRAQWVNSIKLDHYLADRRYILLWKWSRSKSAGFWKVSWSASVSDFVTCTSCIFCAQFCLWDAKFLFQRVPGCNSVADLSLKIVFWTHKFSVGLIDMGNRESQDP